VPIFAGFSYEKTHIMNGSFTSNNTNMIALYKLLGYSDDAALEPTMSNVASGWPRDGTDAAIGAAIHV